MAEIDHLSPEEQQEFDAWVAERPAIIQDMIKSHPPNRLYCLKPSGHRVLISAYIEDKTVTVLILKLYNLVVFEREVFGVKLDDLEECDFPPPSEEVGAILTDKKAIDEFIEMARPFVRRTRNNKFGHDSQRDNPSHATEIRPMLDGEVG